MKVRGVMKVRGGNVGSLFLFCRKLRKASVSDEGERCWMKGM